MSITLWVPAVERPSWSANCSWWNLKTPYNKRLNFYRSGANNPKFTWNKAVMDFLETKDEWLLSVHSDVMVAPKTLMRLLSWDKPLVSALIFMRVGPVLPHVWRKYDGDITGRMVMRINDTRDWLYAHPDYLANTGPFVMEPKPDNALVPVDFTSTSCTLIHRSVLEAMRPICNDVWFQCDDDLRGGGEDRRFFEIAMQAGFDGYVDRSCVVGHLADNLPTSVMDFIAWDYSCTYDGTGEPVAAEKVEQTA